MGGAVAFRGRHGKRRKDPPAGEVARAVRSGQSGMNSFWPMRMESAFLMLLALRMASIFTP